MKLFLIVFSTVIPAKARVNSYIEGKARTRSEHYCSDGFLISRETHNCWQLDKYPEGMPKQYRKAEEYKVLNNSKGIYMFGRDPEKLVEEWNIAVVA